MSMKYLTKLLAKISNGFYFSREGQYIKGIIYWLSTKSLIILWLVSNWQLRWLYPLIAKSGLSLWYLKNSTVSCFLNYRMVKSCVNRFTIESWAVERFVSLNVIYKIVRFSLLRNDRKSLLDWTLSSKRWNVIMLLIRLFLLNLAKYYIKATPK
jgi:hypothetical protein